MLEPDEAKVSRPVLRGLGTGNGPRLPDSSRLFEIVIYGEQTTLDSKNCLKVKTSIIFLFVTTKYGIRQRGLNQWKLEKR
jgi:hypothetical protein